MNDAAIATEKDQPEGAEERHAIGRLAPEEQRAHGAENQYPGDIHHDDLVGCQKAEREAKLMQQRTIVGGQLDGEALRARLAIGL